MFLEFIKFEIKLRLRQPMVYIFFLVFLGLAFSMTVESNLQIGGFGAISSFLNNSPYKIMAITSIISAFSILLATAFMSGAALRDFTNNFQDIIHSSPLNKFSFLFGRFTGSLIVLILLFLAVVIGNVSGTLVSEPEKAGPFIIAAYLQSFFIFYFPNIFLACALFFSVAIIKKSQAFAFASTLFLLFGYAFSMVLLQDLDNQILTYIFDPFGSLSATIVMKYWTISEKNTQVLYITSWLLLNRVLWFSISVIILLGLYQYFSFSDKKLKKTKISHAEEKSWFKNFLSYIDLQLPKVSIIHSFKAHLLQFFSQLKLEYLWIVKSTAFILISVFLIVNLSSSAFFLSDFHGVISYPVTYRMMNIIRGAYIFGFLIIIIYYAGVLVWKEREARFNELNDASPFPSWVAFFSKTGALMLIVATLSFLAIIVSILSQLGAGYTDIEFGLYFKDMFLIEFSKYALFCVLSMVFMSIINNKYLGYLALVAYLLISFNLFDSWGWEHNLYRFADTPSYTYSDFYGFSPYVSGILFFKLYWSFFSAGIAIVGVIFWVRGYSFSTKDRYRQISNSFTKPLKYASLAIFLLFVLTGSFVYYNTNILNQYVPKDEWTSRNALYEKVYKRYQYMAHPKITGVKLNVDIFPEERNVLIKGTYTIKNKTKMPLDSLHFSTFPLWDTRSIKIPDTELILEDQDSDYRIYKLQNPLKPGDSTYVNFEVAYISKGFENQLSQKRITQNGTFLENNMLPQIGYNKKREVKSKIQRLENGLSPHRKVENFSHPQARMTTDFFGAGADYVSYEAILSTSMDQIAVTPGSLINEWTDGDRHYFHYKLDHVSFNSFAFMSAEYEKTDDRWNDIAIEIYHHKKHGKNVPRMIAAIKNTLSYCTEQFNPYTFKQARIVEFPRFATFAQAFVGTMPYSESAGFIANLEAETTLDMVFYIVSHEMAHQWWGHQVTSADVIGQTFVSETMAQYAALMVMEKYYGRDQMHKFLRYEMDKYLADRGRENQLELPLIYNEIQPYIHYNKGSVVMYALRDYIGEEKVNNALRAFINEYAFKEPPYPTSFELMAYIKNETPDSLHYLVHDMFETITLYSNRTTAVTYRRQDDNSYVLYLNTESKKFRADSLGVERRIPLNDWIDIGVYTKDNDGKLKLTYIGRKKIDQQEMEFIITLDAEPIKAGIDPNFLLIDRFPEDNIKNAVSLD